MHDSRPHSDLSQFSDSQRICAGRAALQWIALAISTIGEIVDRYQAEIEPWFVAGFTVLAIVRTVLVFHAERSPDTTTHLGSCCRSGSEAESEERSKRKFDRGQSDQHCLLD